MRLSVVQARINSARLPGKVMKTIGSSPLIGHMLKRIEHSKYIDKTIVAIPKSSQNNVLADFVKGLGCDVFRGSEHDVLDRIFKASLPYKPDAVVRLTGDCVLIDAKIIDDLIELFDKSRLDYAWVDSSFAEGLDAEIISFETLNLVHREADLVSEREHVTQFIHKNPNRFKINSLKNDSDHSSYRIVVDNPEDLEVARHIIEYFEAHNLGSYYSFSEIKRFLDRNPKIAAINSHIIRNEGLIKSLANDKKVSQTK